MLETAVEFRRSSAGYCTPGDTSFAVAVAAAASIGTESSCHPYYQDTLVPWYPDAEPAFLATAAVASELAFDVVAFQRCSL